MNTGREEERKLFSRGRNERKVFEMKGGRGGANRPDCINVLFCGNYTEGRRVGGKFSKAIKRGE